MVFLAAAIAFSSLTSLGAASSSDDVVSCSEFNPKSVKLITFDVFAALMDLETSLTGSVTKILPNLSSYQVKSLVEQWENAYGGYEGTVFNETVAGPQPFQWMLTTTFLQNLSIQVTDEERALLIQAWAILTPWVNTLEVLTQLYNANFTLGALSNGDRGTLTNAMKVFLPAVDTFSLLIFLPLVLSKRTLQCTIRSKPPQAYLPEKCFMWLGHLSTAGEHAKPVYSPH